METEKQIFDERCKALNCPHYIEWDYYGSHLVSCKLQGESDHIEKIAYQCPHEEELNI